METKKSQNAKEAYEAFVLLYIELCRATKLLHIKRIVRRIGEERERNVKYRFLPVVFSTIRFIRDLKNSILYGREDKWHMAGELYTWLYSIIFAYEESNVQSMRPYIRLIELGRTYAPKAEAERWAKHLLDIPIWRSSLEEMNLSPDLGAMTETEYLSYVQKLQESIPDIEAALPIESLLPIDVVQILQKDLNDVQGAYQDYINKHYASIAHLFPVYNKQINIYLHQTDDGKYIARMKMYASEKPSGEVYANDAIVQFKYYNYEAIDQRSIIEWGTPKPVALADIRNFRNIFNVLEIHTDLNRIFIRYASKENVVSYALYIIRARLQHAIYDPQTDVITIKKKKYLYLDKVPESTVLRRCIQAYEQNYIGLVFRFRPRKEIQNILQSTSLKITSVEELSMGCFEYSNSVMPHLFIKDRLVQLQAPSNEAVYLLAEQLKDKLEQCKAGQEQWHAYEDIGAEIFEFLFKDDFEKYKGQIQSSTTTKLQRRDLLVPNNYKKDARFWKRVSEKNSSTNIIVDFKNYKDPISQDVLYSVTKYLNKRVGRFAIIFSRKGMDSSAQKSQLELLKDKDEMVLCVNDADVMEMIDMKVQGQCPADMLEDMYCALCGQ